MRFADHLAAWLTENTSGRVYAVCGGGAMHLNDAICHHPGLTVIAMHHEQAAAFAAEADYRVTGQISTVMVTAGPGGTNALTGVASAYVDSIPMLVISGQVDSRTMHAPNQRQRGVNELDVVAMATPITKFAITLRMPSINMVARAVNIAKAGRPGPVWIDIPLDVQAGSLGIEEAFIPREVDRDAFGIHDCIALLKKADRPLIWIGNGIHIAGAEQELIRFASRTAVPIVSSWNASDILPTSHQSYVGRAGIFGDRASNFAVQNADLILAIGTRLSVPQTGHNMSLFAPKAKKIVVDIDPIELASKAFEVTMRVCADAKNFLTALNFHMTPLMRWDWLISRCQKWKAQYPVILPEYAEQEDGVNSYSIIEELAKVINGDTIIVTDVGAAFISAMQAMPLRDEQRMFHSGGVSAMGYGLPAAIGACIGSGRKPTICLTGDGGLMMNLHELQTVVHHQLPIAILVFCNRGYMTIRTMQKHHFGRTSIADPESGLSTPDFADIASAFGIPAWSLFTNKEMRDWMGFVSTRKHPFLCQFHMKPDQPLAPRLQSRVQDGKFMPTPLEDMFPYLPRDEFNANMATSKVFA